MTPEEIQRIQEDLQRAKNPVESGVTSPDIIVLVLMLTAATGLAWYICRKYGVNAWFCLIVPLAGFFSLYLGLMAFLILLAVNRTSDLEN